MSAEAVIRKAYAAFLARDRRTVEDSFSQDFVFSSPWDDRLDKATYFERCWPGDDRFGGFRIEKMFVDGNDAFIRYEIELKDGGKFRNTEFIRTDGNQIKEVEVYFGANSDKAESENEIRRLLEERSKAVRDKNAADHATLYAKEAVLFGLAPPLQTPYEREKVQAWFDTFSGAIGFETSDFCLTSGDNLKVGRSLNHLTGTKIEGSEEIDVWVRETLVFQRMSGDWKIIHEHTSVPFYMDGSVKAAVDLSPNEK